MKAKERLNLALAQAVALARAGDGAGARAVLAQVAADPDLPVLGPLTAQGLPRRLHACWLRVAKAEADRVQTIGWQALMVPPPAMLAPFVRLTPEERAEWNGMASAPVPRRIHQIWIGDRPVPETVSAWDAHASVNGYRHRLWREADLASLGADRGEVFRKRMAAGDFPGAVDAARYEILAQEGGIYLDCDWYPLTDAESFHHLLPMTGVMAMAETTPRVMGADALLLANSFIAAPPCHPAMTRLCRVLPEVAKALPGAPAWWATGPVIFTRVLREGPVTLAGTGFMRQSFPMDAPLSEVMAARGARKPGSLLLPWKPWGAT